MSRYTVVDLANLFARARHVTQGDAYSKAGMAMLIVFRSLRKLYREQRTEHVVVAIDHGSWRAEVYPPYKFRRRAERLTLTEAQRDEADILHAAQATLVDFLATKTRCTVLDAPGIEADDFIARWVQLHPEDEHVIISSDSDFVQLLTPRVRIYDAMQERFLTVDGVTDAAGQRLAFSLDTSSAKVKSGKPDPDFVAEPEWWRKQLFIKIIRGDAGDGVFSAYPGVRYQGSAKKAGIAQAWADRTAKGYDWNNFFGQTWSKPGWQNGVKDATNAVTVRVLDEYRRNEQLIDLTCQPPTVLARMDDAIAAAAARPPAGMVGLSLKQFCGANDLPTLAREAADHVAYLNAGDPRAPRFELSA